MGQTRTIKKNCNPSWYDALEIETTDSSIFLHLWDADVGTGDDFLGMAKVSLAPGIQWYPVQPGDPGDKDHFCENAKGEVQVEVTVLDE